MVVPPVASMVPTRWGHAKSEAAMNSWMKPVLSECDVVTEANVGGLGAVARHWQLLACHGDQKSYCADSTSTLIVLLGYSKSMVFSFILGAAIDKCDTKLYLPESDIFLV